MTTEPDSPHYPDFGDTQIAFQSKSNKQLKETERLFKLMNNPSLVKIGSKLGLLGIKLKLPFVEMAIRNTMFKQFCGGVNLLDCQETIDELYKNNTLSLLDYGVEGKSTEEEFDAALEELYNAIDFAASNESVPAAICKLTALVPNEVLEAAQEGKGLDAEQQRQYDKFLERVESAAERAYDQGTCLFIDAEESWMQDPMDEIANDLMARYNKDRVTIFNTYQMYRKGTLDRLKADHKKGQDEGYMIGAKIVRGAYMDKERARAADMGYPSPIQDTKADTDADYDASMEYCLDHYETISFVCATHNIKSTQLLANAVIDRGIRKDHPHINFSQLQGMSDYITFNLAKEGFNVAKYVVYGPVKDVAAYLIRRAEENTSVTGEASRELSLIQSETKRRGL